MLCMLWSSIGYFTKVYLYLVGCLSLQFLFMFNHQQIRDGDDEIPIHVLSKSHRTRRLSEDWIEIEDITESHALIDSSLPRCGGYFRLMSFNQFPSYKGY